MESLIEQFDRIGLKLKPWQRVENIFAMNIVGDAFTMKVGEWNEVHVQAVEPDMKQLVLMVHELPGSFEVKISKGSQTPQDIKIRDVGRYQVLVRRQVPEEKRHFLVGKDEMGHPFITRLTGAATSVRQAHESLKPPELRGQTVKGKGKNYKKTGKKDANIVRQGEWFFVETTPEERLLLDTKGNLIERKIPIGPAWDGSLTRSRSKRVTQQGNPHTAEELLVVPGATRSVYVRGKIRHDEHRTLEFPDWMRVIRNNEANARSAGIAWVD